MSIEEINEFEIELSKLMKKQPTAIKFSTEFKGEAVATFIKEENLIYINQKANRQDVELIMDIAHESRHAYQWQIINGIISNKFDDFLKNKWAKEYEKPIFPHQDFKKYALQSIEIDAIAFSETIIEAKFGKFANVPKWLRPKIDKRKEQIKKGW